MRNPSKKPALDLNLGDQPASVLSWQQSAIRRGQVLFARAIGAPPWVQAGGVVAVIVLGSLVAAALSIIAHALWTETRNVLETTGGSGPVSLLRRPAHAWINAHAVGLDLTAQQFWRSWIISGIVFFVLAIAGSIGGRIGWALFGLSAVALTYAGTPPPSSLTAAATVAGAWALVTVPAYTRSRTRLSHPEPEPPQPPPATACEPGVDLWTLRKNGDGPALAAGLYESLLRRRIGRQQRWLHRDGNRHEWTVTTRGQGFRAQDHDGREVAGLAVSGEAIVEVLTCLDAPASGFPIVRWEGPAPGVPLQQKLNWVDGRSLAGSLDDFIASSPDQVQQLHEWFQETRAAWGDPTGWHFNILGNVDVLNIAFPLIDDVSYALTGEENLATLSTHAWIDPTTVVAGNARTWNDFSNHRPEVVEWIIRRLLTASDTTKALCKVLANGSNAPQLIRYDGPAGPLHVMGGDGTHRTHAMRILNAPLMAAEVTIKPLPLQVTQDDVQAPRAGAAHENDLPRLWEGLLRRGLIHGHLISTSGEPRLNVDHAAGGWMLLDPTRAVAVNQAYEKIYPGSLAAVGIPSTALHNSRTWRNWLHAA